MKTMIPASSSNLFNKVLLATDLDKNVISYISREYLATWLNLMLNLFNVPEILISDIFFLLDVLSNLERNMTT